MIGQANLQSRVEQLINNNTFPRFSIFVGPKGSGKKTFAKYVVSYMQDTEPAGSYTYGFLLSDVKVDTIRNIVKDSHKMAGARNIYIIPDADDMSLAAKNALLKVTEEPPNDCYFIMTLEDENNTLETIRSRGTVFHMDRYTPDEIEQYLIQRYGILDNRELSIVRDICETPGDVDIITDEGIIAFYDYVQLVVDNIAEVSLANAFKIPSKVALKEDAEGYDLRLFWKAFMNICRERSYEQEQRLKEYCESIVITSRFLRGLKVKGINKQMLIDCWLMEIRDLWQS